MGTLGSKYILYGYMDPLGALSVLRSEVPLSRGLGSAGTIRRLIYKEPFTRALSRPLRPPVSVLRTLVLVVSRVFRIEGVLFRKGSIGDSCICFRVVFTKGFMGVSSVQGLRGKPLKGEVTQEFLGYDSGNHTCTVACT